MGDLSAVSEESKQFLSSTQDHIIANSSQEPSSDIVIAPLRVDLDQVLDANVINTEEQELNCNEEMKHLKTKTPSEESDDDYQLTVPYIRSAPKRPYTLVLDLDETLIHYNESKSLQQAQRIA